MNQSREQKIIFVFIGLLTVFNIFIWSMSPKVGNDILSVYFLDVGQGDSIFIEAPNGNQMLIDGGKNASLLDELSKYIDFNDRNIDIVMATHPDSDHIGGLPEVFNRYEIATFIDPGKTTDTNVYRELMSKKDLEGSRYVKGERGTVIVLDKKRNIYFQILAPDKNFSWDDTNNFSIIGRLVYGDSSFLLTGDASKAVENILVYADGELLKSDILKVGHHGSKTSSGLMFLEKVQPKSAIISASYNNTYGHPHDDVINNLKKTGVEILETSKDGTIIFETDGVNIWKK